MSDTAPSIQVHVNGEPRQVAAGQALPDFIAALNLHPSGVLVERNGVALLRDELGQIRLAHGDRLEILRVVAGG